MPRPRCCRRMGPQPRVRIFQPVDHLHSESSEVVLTREEFEALRLADAESMYHEQAAQCMKVSRQTFGRTLESAHRNVASALAEGKTLRIGDGEERSGGACQFVCLNCRHEWEVQFGDGRPTQCPSCHAPVTCGKDSPNVKVCCRRSGNSTGESQP